MTDIVERMRERARSASEASKLLARAKTERNAAAEGTVIPPEQGYRGLEPEQTIEWEAADEIEHLRSQTAVPPSPVSGEGDGVLLNIDRSNATAIMDAYQAMPEPSAKVLDHATHILSEWLNDAAPIGERRYREPARALLKFAALVAATPPRPTGDYAAEVEKVNRSTDAEIGLAPPSPVSGEGIPAHWAVPLESLSHEGESEPVAWLIPWRGGFGFADEHEPKPGVFPVYRAAPPASDAFQTRVRPWMMACFGPEVSADKIERNHRFIEEALELVQANGCSQSEAHQLVDYVYGRDQGEINQEVGGVMITLAALCLANGVDMHAAGEVELARVWQKIDKIRAKQAAKPRHSPLPEGAPPTDHLTETERQLRKQESGEDR